MIPTDLSPLANHLWQSTLCVAAVWGLTLALSKNRAAMRYWLWLAASVKFLIPFSLLLGMGGQLGWRSAPAITPPQITIVMNEISRPFAVPAPALQSITPPAPDVVPRILFAVWICGFAISILLWVRCWLQIRSARRGATPLAIDFPIPVLSSPTRLEPGVFGIREPVLLLPEGITECLAPAQLKAILAHELCHVRRQDNLTASIHLVVETIFWFFPLVWWMRARLVEEREQACDEEVLRLGSEPQVYAEGILNVCKSYVESPLHCVSGVSGADLKKRIQAILTARVAGDLGFAKKAALAVVAMAALGLPIVVGIVSAPRIRAQSQSISTPKFETASIQPCEAFRGRSVQDLSPGRFHSECTTVERLVQQAHGLYANGHMNPMSSVTIAGGPAWTNSALYEIDAKAEGPQSQAMMNGPMLQALLEDRLKLKVHRESREAPAYTLTVAKGGPKLQPFQGSCVTRDVDHPPSDPKLKQPLQPDLPAPVLCGTARLTDGGFDMQAATMEDFCTFLLVTLERRIIDETRIAGRFNFHVEFTEDLRPLMVFSHQSHSLPALSDPGARAIDPSLISSVRTVVENLGLNLEATEEPGEFIVIDHVERPTGN
jgi:bla regulator protein blaR1